MENTLFQENKKDLIARARQQLLAFDRQVRLDAKDQQHYQECLDCLHTYQARLYLLPEREEEFGRIPLNDELLDFLGDFSKLKPVVSAQQLTSLGDVFEVDRMTFLAWPRCSNAKWEMWVALRDVITARWEELLRYHSVCNESQCFPVLEDNREYTLAEKVDRMCDQYLEALQTYVQYHPKVKVLVDRLSMVLQIGADLEDLAAKMGVTRERLRQFKERYLGQLFEGGLEEVPHLRIDCRLIAMIRDFEQTPPRYKSQETVNRFFGCEDYRRTHLPAFLKMKKLFEEDLSGTYPYFDQPYFLPDDESVELIKTYVSTLIKVMGASAGADVRPMRLDAVMAALSALEPDFHFEEERVLEVLRQHTWVEIAEDAEGVPLYQLHYSRLYDYQKIARIVFEEKSVNYDQILKKDREKTTDGKLLTHVGDNAIISRKNYDWVCLSGVEGTLIYEESGNAPQSLMKTIQQICKDFQVFTFTEVMAELARRNYTAGVNENSVKIYILRDCVSSLDDAQLYCHQDALATFSSHRWRSRNRNIRNIWVAFAVQTLRKVASHSMAVEELNQLIFQQTEAEEGGEDVKNPVAYMRERLCVRDLLGVENKKVFLTPKALELSEDELEQLEVNITCKPKSAASEQAERVIYDELSAAADKTLPIKILKEKCMPFFQEKSSSYFYTFIKRKFTFQLERFEREGIQYLKLVE